MEPLSPHVGNCGVALGRISALDEMLPMGKLWRLGDLANGISVASVLVIGNDL